MRDRRKPKRPEQVRRIPSRVFIFHFPAEGCPGDLKSLLPEMVLRACQSHSPFDISDLITPLADAERIFSYSVAARRRAQRRKYAPPPGEEQKKGI